MRGPPRRGRVAPDGPRCQEIWDLRHLECIPLGVYIRVRVCIKWVNDRHRDEGEERMNIIDWLGSSTGRVARVVAGIVLIIIGFVGGGGWITLSIIGVIPLVAGMANVCLLAPLFGRSLKSGHH